MCRRSIYLILLLAFSLTIGIASGQTVRINFQSRTQGSREVPVGYLPDYGDLFGDRGNGWSYGWTVNKADSGRDRDINPDQRFDTNNSLIMWNTGTGSWEIAVPNGTYNVYIVGGDAGYFDSTQSYLVEDVTITDPTPYPPGNTTGNRYDEYKVTVTVADERLTIAPAPGVTGYVKICFIDIADVRVAQPVSPADRGLWPSPSAFLTWTPGVSAVQHDVYIGEDFNVVRDATTSMPGIYKGRQTEAKYPASSVPMTLEPGKTYYWRIDEVNGADIWRGDVWFFKVQLLTAYDPQPIDGGLFVDPNDKLSWSKGATAFQHLVYFGDDKTKVENATTATPEYKGTRTANNSNWDPPGSLMLSTTYYWRIDEKESGGNVNRGSVWSFTTAAHFGGGLKGQYYNNTDLTGDPVLTRIDPKIDFDWGTGTPDPNVPPDGFSVKWTGLVEIPAAGEWTFSTHTDDGTRLWVDGQRLVNVWGTSRPLTWDSNTITLNAGFHTIEMNYFEANITNHIAIAHLAWQGPLVPVRQYIPQGAFLPPFVASSPNPADNATGVRQTPTLSWTAGDNAVQHDVYFGADYDAVFKADITTANIYRGRQELEDANYVPTEAPLQWGKTYYWRVDEIEADEMIRKGFVWRFTVADYAVIEDFEDYDANNKIYDTWLDYYMNNTGMTVGHFDPPFAERSITHNGRQSMYVHYDNDGTINEGTAYEKSGTLFYSEAERQWTDAQDWSANGVNSLTLWFRGIPASVGSFTAGPPIKMTAGGVDIWGTADQFHFAYKQLSGVGNITARVVSVSNTDPWAKAGVMIRESLAANSAHIMVAVTPGNGVVYQRRPSAGAASEDVVPALTGITAPQWVRLTRSGNTFTAEYSANGANWNTLGSVDMPMLADVYVGLCLSSHNVNAICTAEFSNVANPGTGSWQSQDIGIRNNVPEGLYVMLQDSSGISSPAIKYSDPAATTFNVYTEWNIPLTSFTGVNLQAIQKLTIGVGDRANTQPGGSGDLYIDDIGLKLP